MIINLSKFIKDYNTNHCENKSCLVESNTPEYNKLIANINNNAYIFTDNLEFDNYIRKYISTGKSWRITICKITYENGKPIAFDDDYMFINDYEKAMEKLREIRLYHKGIKTELISYTASIHETELDFI